MDYSNAHHFKIKFLNKNLKMNMKKGGRRSHQMEPHDEKGDSEVQLKKERNGSLKYVQPWSEISCIEEYWN